MSAFLRGFSLLIGLLVGSLAASAQVPMQELPSEFVPLKPATQEELNQREALKKFTLGLLYRNEDRIFEALSAFEEAVRLDPQAPASYKEQVPLLLSLDHGAEALKCCQKALELDPGDYETWYVQARLQKALSMPKDARVSLEQGLKKIPQEDRPELVQQMYFDLGAILEMEGEFQKAGDAFQASAKILDHPDHLAELGSYDKKAIVRRAGEVYERIGLLYRKAKKPIEAIAAYQKAVERAPDLASRISYNLAQLYLDQGEHAKALPHLDAYLRFQPQGTEAYEMKIRILANLQRSREILPWLEQAVEADPHNAGLQILLAKQYAGVQQIQRAEKIYLNLAEKSPTPEVYQGLFRMYREERPAGIMDILNLLNRTLEKVGTKEELIPSPDLRKARAMIAVVREDGELSLELLKVGLQDLNHRNENLKFETVHFLAVLADKNRKNEEAEKFYRAALSKAQPGNEAIIYSGLLRTLWKVGKFNDIVQVCDAGLARSEATSKILFLNEKAKALARLDQHREAVAVANRAVEVAGDHQKISVRHMRVRVLLMAEKYAEAEAECLAMLKEYTRPSEAIEIQYLLSNVYSGAKQMAKAEEQLEKILRLDPSNATANNDLGYTWADQGKNLKEAEEMIRRAIDLDRRHRQTGPGAAEDEDKDNAAYIDSLGWVLFRQGKFEEARQELEKAVALPDGNDPTIYDHLGDVYFRLGQTERARECWRKAVQLYEEEKRRKMDERYREVIRKLKMN